MIDSRENGGLGLTNQALGDINGTFGTGAFMAGSLLGGLVRFQTRPQAHAAACSASA
jgi:hypothetical protein